MRALLHYNFLKGRRDLSLLAFVIIPAFLPIAVLCGSTFTKAWSPHEAATAHYPMFMEVHYSPSQNAKMATDVASFMSAFFAIIPAFWSLRNEMITRSVAALAMAARSPQIVLASVLYATAIACAAWMFGIASIGILTTAISPTLARSAAEIVVLAFAFGALGTLTVIISPQPGMIAGALPLAAVALSFVEKKKAAAPQMMGVLVFAILATAIASFVLERKCAR